MLPGCRSLFAAGLVLLASSAAAQNDFLEAVIGRYEGQLVDGQGNKPVTTRLYRQGGKGALVGDYTFGGEQGRLEDCREIGMHRLQCTWIDIYGRGVLQFTFDPEANRFLGRWGTKPDSAIWWPWDGRRIGPAV